MEEFDNYKYEKELRDNGIKYIAGVDEVGRGPLVGPVVAACVVLPEEFNLDGLTDSKKLSEKKFDARIVRLAISKQCHILDSNSTETFELNKNSKWSKDIYDILRFHNYYITLIYEYSYEDVIIIEPKQTQKIILPQKRQ